MVSFLHHAEGGQRDGAYAVVPGDLWANCAAFLERCHVGPTAGVAVAVPRSPNRDVSHLQIRLHQGIQRYLHENTHSLRPGRSQGLGP